MNRKDMASGLGDIAAMHRLPNTKKDKLEPPKHLLSISEIRPHLFLSGFGCITDAKLKREGITHLVDCTNLQNAKKFSGVEYLEVPVEDTSIANIAQYFETVTSFIDSARASGGKALVFCAAGVSRSATLTIMYLVLSEKLSLKDAYYDVNQKRPIISPNVGFWQQMIDFESSKGSESTVKLLRGRMARPVPDVYLHRREAVA